MSPAHALIVDEVFMRADTLINGISITQEETMPEQFTYYHIELENHELIMAEGVPVETFTGSREVFDNYDEYVTLYGEQPIMEDMDRPRMKKAELLPQALKHRLMDRAIKLFPKKTKNIA